MLCRKKILLCNEYAYDFWLLLKNRYGYHLCINSHFVCHQPLSILNMFERLRGVEEGVKVRLCLLFCLPVLSMPMLSIPVLSMNMLSMPMMYIAMLLIHVFFVHTLSISMLYMPVFFYAYAVYTYLYIYVCIYIISRRSITPQHIKYSSKSLDVVQSLYFSSKLPSSGTYK